MGFLVTNVEKSNESASSSAYVVESLDTWHISLGYVNMQTLERMKNLAVIPEISMKSLISVKSMLKANYTKKPFNQVIKELMNHYHSGLDDIKCIETKGDKRHYIPLVDDYSRFRYISY